MTVDPPRRYTHEDHISHLGDGGALDYVEHAGPCDFELQLQKARISCDQCRKGTEIIDFAIAAHGEGEFGYENFHLYLMAGRKIIRSLPAIEEGNILDTGAKAFNAAWSPDLAPRDRQVSQQ